LVIGVSKASWENASALNNAMELASIVLRDLHQILNQHVKDFSFSSQAMTAIEKSLSMLDMIVGNPMDSINMIIDLLDQKQSHVSLPTLLDHLDLDPRYDRYRVKTYLPRFETAILSPKARVVDVLDAGIDKENGVPGQKKVEVPGLPISTMKATAEATAQAPARSRHSYPARRYPRLFGRKENSRPRSSSSYGAMTAALVTAMTSPRWIEERLRGAFSPRIAITRPKLFAGTSPQKIYPGA
jgi:hypothetical protein